MLSPAEEVSISSLTGIHIHSNEGEQCRQATVRKEGSEVDEVRAASARGEGSDQSVSVCKLGSTGNVELYIYSSIKKLSSGNNLMYAHELFPQVETQEP